MPLQGTLRDFGIADIFQLIAQQQKTGILQLRRAAGNLDVFFAGGLICAARPPDTDPQGLLAQQLVRAGVLKPFEVRQGQEASIQNLTTFRDALVDTGLVPNERITEIEKLYCMEAIYDLFGWQDGDFVFVQQDDIAPNPDSFPPVSAEHVLMDGFRMVDEWPGIRRIVPDPNARVQKLSTPQPAKKAAKPKKKSADAFDLSDVMDDDEDEESGGLSDEEKKVLETAQTGQTVQFIIDRSRMGAFEATKAVADLVTKGYLKLDIVSAQLESAAGFFEEEEPQRGGLVVLGVVAALGLIILAAGVPRLVGSVGRIRHAFQEVKETRVTEGLDRVRAALEVHRLLNGAYPDSLAELERSGIAPPELGLIRADAPYLYRLGDTGYELSLRTPVK